MPPILVVAASMLKEKVRVDLESEVATSGKPARVLVYEDDVLISEIVASIKMEQWKDGIWCHCVKLEKK